MRKLTGQNNSLSQFASEFPHSVRQNTSIGGPSVEDKQFTQVRINNFLTELGNCRHKQFPRSVRRRREHIRARRDSLSSAFSTPRLPGLGPRTSGAVATTHREAVGEAAVKAAGTLAEAVNVAVTVTVADAATVTVADAVAITGTRAGRGAGALGARGAKKRRPGWGAGRCKISGALRFKTDITLVSLKPTISSVSGRALRYTSVHL